MATIPITTYFVNAVKDAIESVILDIQVYRSRVQPTRTIPCIFVYPLSDSNAGQDNEIGYSGANGRAVFRNMTVGVSIFSTDPEELEDLVATTISSVVENLAVNMKELQLNVGDIKYSGAADATTSVYESNYSIEVMYESAAHQQFFNI